MSTRAWQPRCAASCPRCAASAVLSTCNATCWPRSRIACASVWRARLPPSSGPPGLAESKKRLAEITARWHKELPEAVNVLERGFTAATQFYAFPEPHWARTAHHEQPRAPAHRDQASDPERRRLPRPSQRAPPHHCGCSKDYCGLERTSLPGSHASRTEGGRQGSLTEASRSFLSLLHTTRDLTPPYPIPVHVPGIGYVP